MAAKNKKAAEAVEKQKRRGRRRKETPYRRILMGIRVEEHVAKLLRALAILQGVPVGEFVEQLLLAAIEGENALADAKGKIPPQVKKKVEALKSSSRPTISSSPAISFSARSHRSLRSNIGHKEALRRLVRRQGKRRLFSLPRQMKERARPWGNVVPCRVPRWG